MAKPNSLERKHLGADELTGWRLKLYVVIFEADTRAGKAFDVGLFLTILASVAVVMLESIEPVRADMGAYLAGAEWVFTVLFTVEYVLRLSCVGRPRRYATSFFGVVDVLAVIPTYLSLLLPGAQFLLVIRLLRILRVFRVLKLAHYISEADVLMRAMQASRRKITIFVVAVLTLVVILGSLMYLVEGGVNGFSSIPRAVYWTIVTLTTVGYGDIAPQTPWGQALAAVVMITGYAIIAVPTGIVTSEITRLSHEMSARPPRRCPECERGGHDENASYCNHCGSAQ